MEERRQHHASGNDHTDDDGRQPARSDRNPRRLTPEHARIRDMAFTNPSSASPVTVQVIVIDSPVGYNGTGKPHGVSLSRTVGSAVVARVFDRPGLRAQSVYRTDILEQIPSLADPLDRAPHRLVLRIEPPARSSSLSAASWSTSRKCRMPAL